MRFSGSGGNRAPSRSSGGGGNIAPIMMDKFKGGNEGSNRASPPIRATFINTYVKFSRPGGVRKGGSEKVHGGSRKGAKSSGQVRVPVNILTSRRMVQGSQDAVL